MVLSCDLNALIPPVNETVARYNYHKGDYESLNNRLAEIDWKSELSGMDTEEAWAHLSAILNDKLTKHIPKSVPKKDGRRQIWTTKEASAKYRKKQRAWKQYQKSKNYIMSELQMTKMSLPL